MRNGRFVLILLSSIICCGRGFSIQLLHSTTSPLHRIRQSTTFLGCATFDRRCRAGRGDLVNVISMRKQKASDRRTRRRQRGEIDDDAAVAVVVPSTTSTMTTSGAASVTTRTSNPMQSATWKAKARVSSTVVSSPTTPGGRGRSQKRTTLYQVLQHYHSSFLDPLTCEYKAEEDEVLGRIQASLDDPLGLELAGYALYDMYAERRGNLFGQEVYRLVKAIDATTSYPSSNNENGGRNIDANSNRNNIPLRYLPPNHKFSNNDVIVLTEQPNGSGDFFTDATLPISETAICAEAIVLNVGPTYLDISMAAGCFEGAFGLPGNDISGQGNKHLRLRADQFVSNVPYQRMVAALSQLSSIPENGKSDSSPRDAEASKGDGQASALSFAMDAVLKEAIMQTHAVTDPSSPFFANKNWFNLEELSNKIAKPPMASSPKMATKILRHMLANAGIFRNLNAPQRAAVYAALSRRLTLIQGPPGTGKTCVASAIGFGFAQQCKLVSEHSKVLACAFSNVGADNLAEGLIHLGLRVVRVGKPSAVVESLWTYTLDAAIDRDPAAQKALQNAARAAAELAKINRRAKTRDSKTSTVNSDRRVRDDATAAVKASIQASNVAAVKALRDADVIVCTSIGAADPRLLAACGIVVGVDDTSAASSSGGENRERPASRSTADRVLAPDGLPPLSLPFVVIDEACQSVEPASLVPIVATNSCRSLVLLGDPCQLPPTVKSQQAEKLSLSLMERFAAILPSPNIVLSPDDTAIDSTYLDGLAIKNAVSLIRSRSTERQARSYGKLYGGSILLSIQYRMHPSIAALPSAIFYDSLLTTPQVIASSRRFPTPWQQSMPCEVPNMCVRLVNVGGRDNERQGSQSKYTSTLYGSAASSREDSRLEQQTTFWNEAEAQTVISLVKTLLVDYAKDPSVKCIGIISPYNGQVQLIKLLMANDAELQALLQTTQVSIETKSVDGYQGRERDAIIFSAVRSNRQDRIGFLHDWRRMNVALTRAKSALLVIGDLQTLSGADRNWEGLIKWASGVGCIEDSFRRPIVDSDSIDSLQSPTDG